MKFDDVLHLLGDFGCFQRQQYVLMAAAIFSTAIQLMMIVFTLATPRHRCAIPGLHNDTWAVQDEAHQRLIDEYIPIDHDALAEPMYSSCQLYTSPSGKNLWDYGPDGKDGAENSNLPASSLSSFETTRNESMCDRWVFDTSQFSSTIVTQMGFVCGREMLKSHAVMTLMSGQMFGCFSVGPLADAFGRRTILMVSIVLHSVSSIGTAFAPNLYVLGFIFLLKGYSISGVNCAAYTLAIEFVGTKWRHVAGLSIFIAWTLGMAFICLCAFLVRDWFTLQLIVSCPTVLFFLYFWIVPESARWLLSKGREKKVDTIVRRAAKRNSVKLPDGYLVRKDETVCNTSKCASFLAILKHPKILIRVLIIYFNWAVCSLTYYGLSLNVGELSGDIYMNFLLGAIVEALGYVISAVMSLKIERKIIYCSSLLLGSIACILTIFPCLFADGDARWTIRCLAITGKFGVSAAFGVAWMLTSELFPTTLRATITSSSSFCGRLGAMLAAYVAYLKVDGPVQQVMPQIIFGTSGLIAGILACFLPGTKNTDMPESIQDAEHIEAKSMQVEDGNEADEMKPMTRQVPSC